MRARIRQEKPPPAEGFDLKLSPGGRVDVEFIAQYLVLAHAHARPEIAVPRGTADLLRLAETLGLLGKHEGDRLADAFVGLCALERRQTLQGLGTVVDVAATAAWTYTITQAWHALFGPTD
jgi:glutamate-ammonia-ligase adenylyltransferase